MGILVQVLLIALMVAGQALAQGAVDAYLRREMELNALPGLTVAIVRNGKPELVRAYGVADVQTGEVLTTETLMELASVSKAFTGLAVLKLATAGVLDVEDPVVRHLPALEGASDEGWRQARVRHLLRHTSGLRPRHDFRVPCCGRPGDGDLVLAVQQLKDVALESRPGDSFHYANSNYVLLAAIIERVSELPYAAFLEEEVLQPLGLQRTTPRMAEARRLGMATLHEWQWGRVRASPSRYLGWHGSSLVKSTGTDMSRYLEALLSPEVLGIANWKNRLVGDYDYGWSVDRSADWLDQELLLEHGGKLWGADTAVILAPGKRAGVAVLVNLGTDRAEPIARALLRHVLGMPLQGAERVPQYEIPDMWARIFVLLAGVFCAANAWYLLRLRRRWAKSGWRWVSSPIRVGRGLVFCGFAGYLPYALYGGDGPPLEAMPASIRVALPPLVWTVSPLLALAGIGGLLNGRGTKRHEGD